MQHLNTSVNNYPLHHRDANIGVSKTPQSYNAAAAADVINRQLIALTEGPDIFIDKIKTHLIKTNELINHFWFTKIDQIMQGFKPNIKSTSASCYIIEQVCDSIMENWIPRTKERVMMSMAIELLEDRIVVIISMTNTFTYGATCSVEIPHRDLNGITSTYLLILTKYYEKLILDHNTRLITTHDNKEGHIKNQPVSRLSTNSIFSFDPILDNKQIMYQFHDVPTMKYRGGEGIYRRPPRDIKNSYCTEKAIKLKTIPLLVGDKMILLLHGVSLISQYINSFDDAYRVEKLINTIYTSYEHVLDLDTKTNLILTIKELSSLSQTQKLYYSVYEYIDKKDLMDVELSGTVNDIYSSSSQERDLGGLTRKRSNHEIDHDSYWATIKQFQRVLLDGLAMCCKIDNCKTCVIVDDIVFGKHNKY
jgi:hypothetical protein